MKAALLIVVAHAAAFVLLSQHCRRAELVVEVRSPPAAMAPSIDAALPAALADRIEIDDAGTGPGLHHRTWRVRYRGGVERAVGASQLVGPFQRTGAPACSGRILVGQRLLDDGASSGTIATAMKRELEAALRGEDIFAIGALRSVDGLTLRWAELAHHAEDRALVGEAPHGYVRAAATLVFERVRVPVVVALVPEARRDDALRFRTAARAGLAFDNRTVQWLSDKLGVDAVITRLARRELDDALITALAPPPPFGLPGGQTLRFTYCDAPTEIVEGAYAALPFGVVIERNARDPRLLPPMRGLGPRVAPSRDAALGLELDLDALNALLYELWRGGFLDRQLQAAGLDRRFNEDPTVAELLTLRLAPLTLALPPVVSATRDGLRLAAEARAQIHDGAHATSARVWGAIDFRFAPRSATEVAPTALAIGALALSCERAAKPDTLVPCYDDLVAAIRGRSDAFHGALTDAFAHLISEIFLGRLGAAGVPAELEIRRAIPSVAIARDNATVHFDLDGSVIAR